MARRDGRGCRLPPPASAPLSQRRQAGALQTLRAGSGASTARPRLTCVPPRGRAPQCRRRLHGRGPRRCRARRSLAPPEVAPAASQRGPTARRVWSCRRPARHEPERRLLFVGGGRISVFERRRQQAPPTAVLPRFCRGSDRRKSPGMLRVVQKLKCTRWWRRAVPLLDVLGGATYRRAFMRAFFPVLCQRPPTAARSRPALAQKARGLDASGFAGPGNHPRSWRQARGEAGIFP
jgi:hypothetical protein